MFLRSPQSVAGTPHTLFIETASLSHRCERAATELCYRAHDLVSDQNGNVVPGDTPGTLFSPRVVGIKLPAALRKHVTCTYNNLFSFARSTMGNYTARVQIAGVLRAADNIKEHAYYTMMTPTIGAIDYRNNAEARAASALAVAEWLA